MYTDPSWGRLGTYVILTLSLYRSLSLWVISLVHPLFAIWCAAHARYLVGVVLNVELVVVGELWGNKQATKEKETKIV